MTEEKKLPTIEEWFEANKNENECAEMTVKFKKFILCTSDQAVNEEFGDSLLKRFFVKMVKEEGLTDVTVTFDLVIYKETDGRIVYSIDDSKVELV